MRLKAGQRIERYELVCRLANGGMGEIWLARVKKLQQFERLFAIKTVLPSLADDENFRAMFLDEARVASSIFHPNVASILDVGEERGTLYLVMEWVDGDSISSVEQVLRKKRECVPWGVSMRIIADACAGLHAMHELRDPQGNLLEVVHRDATSHNIMVDRHGHVKVIDFGIAKARDRLAAHTPRDGSIKGKVRYMAPEHATGGVIDRRADIWSIGVILYSLAQGELPLDGGTDVEVLARLLLGPKIPRLKKPVPQPLADIVEKCLMVNPNDRYTTAYDVQQALEAAMARLSIATSQSEVREFVQTRLCERIQVRDKTIASSIAKLNEHSEGPSEASSLPEIDMRESLDSLDAVPTRSCKSNVPANSLPSRRKERATALAFTTLALALGTAGLIGGLRFHQASTLEPTARASVMAPPRQEPPPTERNTKARAPIVGDPSASQAAPAPPPSSFLRVHRPRTTQSNSTSIRRASSVRRDDFVIPGEGDRK